MTSPANPENPGQFFPLRTVGDIRALFSSQLSSKNPDLSLLSIVSGALEHQWTQSKVPGLASQTNEALTSTSNSNLNPSQDDYNPCLLKIQPPLDWDTVQGLQTKFESIIKGFCDVQLLQDAKKGQNLRPIIKHVADIIWNTLSKSQYKDRPHLQSIYSYLTGNKLDCFGVAFAVVAACQLLELDNIHLALSEDHAWVVYGEDGTETAEVTWHGKGNEDKRGKPVEIEKAKNSWLYVAGQPVVCDRHMEVSALVSSINPAITANLDSIECGAMQQELLWLLYDMGHLKQYPMALGNLGDLEEICPTLGRPPCSKLFMEAIQVNREVFHNHHVYPYTYMAGYYYRKKEYKKALKYWSQAAEVIRIYRYSKDDEEIYKEFMEIANELIPHLVKSISLDPKLYNEVLKDPECFAFLLKFYDGICCWEEGSPTPVLHIGWAKHMVASCSKFEPGVRSKLTISKDESDQDEEGSYALKLESAKMMGLQKLLATEKLNTSAIQLQLTAQSQSRDGKGNSSLSELAETEASGGRPKRSRRE